MSQLSKEGQSKFFNWPWGSQGQDHTGSSSLWVHLSFLLCWTSLKVHVPLALEVCTNCPCPQTVFILVSPTETQVPRLKASRTVQ